MCVMNWQASFSRTSAAPSSPPALVLDDATLAAVSRAIMGRLDIVDLVGRNTALEAAERVSLGWSIERVLHLEYVLHCVT